MSEVTHTQSDKERNSLESVSIRFAGDSGDGIQLTGDRFATVSAVLGNDVITMADFPAEIRAPLGTIAGVSGYQLSLGASDVYTPGDMVDILVALNPAALKANLDRVKENGILILNKDAFTSGNLAKAGWEGDPLEEVALSKFRKFPVPITTFTREALKDSQLDTKAKDRCKNFFALGLTCWLLDRPLEPTLAWIEEKFGKKKDLVEANQKVLRHGYDYGETTELFSAAYDVPVDEKSKVPGLYRYINGNSALSLGLITGAQKAKRKLFLGSYPITPASDILHFLSNYKNFGVTTLQAEDEIAAVGAAIGASFAGSLGITTTSGPGLALKSEFINLAVMTELPLVVVDVQRAGPSTGMPTKTEQTDLLQALYGRNGESPIVVLAPATPGDCFSVAIEACRIAIEHMTPVILLSDAHLANGSEPWLIPDVEKIAEINAPQLNLTADEFEPYQRDETTLARPWMVPGMAGFEHTLGGLEKEDGSGNVCYDPENHERMTYLRAEKVARVANTYPETEVFGDESGDLLILGWGSSLGAIRKAVMELREQGKKVGAVNLRYINPLPNDLKEICKRFKKIIVPENNTGQLCLKLRSEYLLDFIAFSQVRGQPIRVNELEARALEVIGSI